MTTQNAVLSGLDLVRTHSEVGQICARIPRSLRDRVRALVRADKFLTVDAAVAQALEAWANAHPLAGTRLSVPEALKPGRRRRARRIASDFVVIVEDEDAAVAVG